MIFPLILTGLGHGYGSVEEHRVGDKYGFQLDPSCLSGVPKVRS